VTMTNSDWDQMRFRQLWILFGMFLVFKILMILNDVSSNLKEVNPRALWSMYGGSCLTSDTSGNGMDTDSCCEERENVEDILVGHSCSCLQCRVPSKYVVDATTSASRGIVTHANPVRRSPLSEDARASNTSLLKLNSIDDPKNSLNGGENFEDIML
jgi:hypothetical protein